jgi:hypothetical protein
MLVVPSARETTQKTATKRFEIEPVRAATLPRNVEIHPELAWPAHHREEPLRVTTD